jgi:Zn-dependent protease
LAPTLVGCPACGALVHAETLKSLAADAESAERAGDVPVALAKWRAALELLPPTSQQHATILARTAELGRGADNATQRAAKPPVHPVKRVWAAIVTGALLFLSKAKLLLLGLTKLSTISSMLLFLGVYWSLWGWRFALGFVVCIYIHEMGHVAQLARYGIAASPPMFIPGLGAFVRLKQSPADVRQDARVGLAGPIWGLAAALVAYAIGLATGAAIWAAIARTAAFLNLFNLLPIWQLDGGRGFRSLARLDRWIAVAALLVAWALTSQGFLLLLAGGAVFRAVGKDAPADHDWPALATYIALIAVLAPPSKVPVVTAAR